MWNVVEGKTVTSHRMGRVVLGVRQTRQVSSPNSEIYATTDVSTKPSKELSSIPNPPSPGRKSKFRKAENLMPGNYLA
jgi:hypothetical protein